MSDIFSIEELREALGPRRPQYAELWVTRPSGETMCALINGDLGWLLVPRDGHDGDLVSRNPAYAGDPETEIDYQLDNGQIDRYPASWALPFREVRAALEEFLSTGTPPSWVAWEDDTTGVRARFESESSAHSRTQVLAKIERIFPRRNPEDILAVLDDFGADPTEQERDRVQLAILKICQEQGGSGLERILRMAKTNYRDVLGWAESPGQTSPAWEAASPEDRKRIMADDRRQYESWLKGED